MKNIVIKIGLYFEIKVQKNSLIMKFHLFYLKVRSKLWNIIVRFTCHGSIYPYLYRSYWHKLIFPSKKNVDCSQFYFSARPNIGAGIGHQIANWLAGYWFAKFFKLKFAHIPFSKDCWDEFLGFGNNEITVQELVKKRYKKILIPLFDEDKITEIECIISIMKSYSGKKVIFICEQDQFYRDQFNLIENVQQKFYNSNSRKNDNLIYKKEFFNIALHVRRGDILIAQKSKNKNLEMRWQSNEYFINLLSNVFQIIKTQKKIAIYLFSQGSEEDFIKFSGFENIHLCLNQDEKNSFLHMVYADLLITSKSSFSYKPALLNKGIKISPSDFWHGYPKCENWILADKEGNLIEIVD